MNPEQFSIGRRHFLYDRDLLAELQPEWFDASFHRDNGSLLSEGLGRAPVQFIQLADLVCVLRHYRRGGLVGKLIQDRYVWIGLEHTRAWHEWHLLRKLRLMHLPVPRPVATQVQHNGLWYCADLITEKIAATESLSQRLVKAPISADLWTNIGKIVRQFHNAGVYHADLNAHNILIDPADKVYLIDFDKGALRAPSSQWQLKNITRLKRSLYKLKGLPKPFHFQDADWETFQAAYG